MTTYYPSIRGNTCHSRGKKLCLIWRSRWRCFDLEVRAPSSGQSKCNFPRVRWCSQHTLHGFEEPSTRMLQTLFHPVVSSPNCLAKTTCRYPKLHIFGDKFYQWSPYPMKSIWNPYVHGRRRSSSLLVADCLVIVWNKSYGILEVHLARRQAYQGASFSDIATHSNNCLALAVRWNCFKVAFYFKPYSRYQRIQGTNPSSVMV